jgi:hypothetical protein
VFLTNRPEDQKMFNELRGLSQAVIQNGGSLHDIIELYSTNSVRQMKKVFKSLKDKQDAMQQQQLDMQQQQQEQQQEQAMAQLQQAQASQERHLANDNYQAELDRINKKEIALIAAESKAGSLADVDESGTPDVLEISRLAFEQSKATKDYETKMNDIQSKNTLAAQKLQVEREKLKVARENQANDLAIAKENAKNRASKKTK